MDIGALRIFKAVAEQGSISKAAQVLHYVQSNVTARIRQLEKELDADLFYRKPRGMVLTSAGKTLLGYADQALRLLEEAQKAVRENGELKGPLALGSLESAAAVRLPAVLARYQQTYPEVDLTLVTGSSQELLAKVLDYGLDGAFVSGKVRHPEIDQEHMFNEELVLLTSPQDRSLKEINKKTLLVLRFGCNYLTQLESWLGEQGIMPHKTMEFGTREGILGYVSAGMGIALFPRSIVDKLHFANRVRIHKIPSKYAIVPTMFIWRKDILRTKALNVLVQMVREDAGISLPPPQNHRVMTSASL